VFNPEGTVAGVYPGNTAPEDYSENKEYFKEAARTNAPVFVDLHRNDSEASVCLGWICPLGSGSKPKTPQAMVYVGIDAARDLYPLIEYGTALNKSAETLIFRREKDSILYLNNVRGNKESALSLKIPLTRSRVIAVQAVQSGNSTFEGVDYLGNPCVAVARSVPGTPWVMVSKVNSEEVFAPLKSFDRAMFVVFFAGLGFYSILGVMFWKRKNEIMLKASNQQLQTAVQKVIINEDALKTAKEHLHNIINAIGDPVFVKDHDSRFTLANDALCSIIGMKRENIIGKTLGESLPEDQMEHFLEVDKMVLKSGEENICEELLAGSDGKTLTIVTKKTRYVNEHGDKFLVGVIRDITERRQIEAAMMQADKMSAIGQLAGGVAHEINNPLSVILGFAQGINKKILETDPLYVPLKSIEREAVRCKNLIENLLTFSRTSETSKKNEDINRLIEDALSMIEPQIKINKIVLVTELGAGLPGVLMNRNQVQQVIVNLCSNAIDAVSGCAEDRRMAIKTRSVNDNFIEISVSDNGPGIPPETQKRIFEPFFTTKEVGKGTGLGLSLSYEIIKKHNGTIEVESPVKDPLNSIEKKGAKFIVRLPVN